MRWKKLERESFTEHFLTARCGLIPRRGRGYPEHLRGACPHPPGAVHPAAPGEGLRTALCTRGGARGSQEGPAGVWSRASPLLLHRWQIQWRRSGRRGPALGNLAPCRRRDQAVDGRLRGGRVRATSDRSGLQPHVPAWRARRAPGRDTGRLCQRSGEPDVRERRECTARAGIRVRRCPAHLGLSA